MSEYEQVQDEAVRRRILEEPHKVLADNDVVRALIGAGNSGAQRNVVDLRGVLVDRLEQRLDLLQDTHRDVVAAAYENLAGTNQVHRAVLSILRPKSFGAFVRALRDELQEKLVVEGLHLCFEGDGLKAGEPLGPRGAYSRVLLGLPKGGVNAYFGGERNAGRAVVVRSAGRSARVIYGATGADIQSEAVLRLDLGAGRYPAMLAIGSDNQMRFEAGQATDLLEFLGEALECMLQQWLK